VSKATLEQTGASAGEGQRQQCAFHCYAGSNLPQHQLEAEDRGAQGSANDPHELFELTVGQLLR
jgi:hypothetical protein